MATLDDRMLSQAGARRSFLFLRAPPTPDSLVLLEEDEALNNDCEVSLDDLPEFESISSAMSGERRQVGPADGALPSFSDADSHTTSYRHSMLGMSDTDDVDVIKLFESEYKTNAYGTIRRSDLRLRMGPRYKTTSTSRPNSTYMSPALTTPKEVDEVSLEQTSQDDDVTTSPLTNVPDTPELPSSPTTAVPTARTSMVAEFGDFAVQSYDQHQHCDTDHDRLDGPTARTSMLEEQDHQASDLDSGQLGSGQLSHSPEKEETFQSSVWYRAVNHRHSVPASHGGSVGRERRAALQRNSLPEPETKSAPVVHEETEVCSLSDETTPTLSRQHSQHAVPTLSSASDKKVDEEETTGIPKAMTKSMRERHAIAMEILETERTYVERLTVLLREFHDPLLKIADTPERILSPSDIKEIFQHLGTILNFHQVLLQCLEERINVDTWNPVEGCLGDIFSRLAPFLKSYDLYLRNCSHAMERVSAHMGSNPAFVRFLRETDKRQKHRGLSLQAYLLEPMQRIPRYRLLLMSLMKKTAVDHPDYHQLAEALCEIEKVANYVNEALRHHDEAKKTLDIQRSLNGFSGKLLIPGRRLLKRGSVKKICRRNHQRREFFLFSDILIYASPGLMEDVYIFHRKLPLEYCKVVSVADSETIRNGFQILSPDKSFQVYTDTPEEKQAWIAALSDAIRERREAQQTLRKEKKERPHLDSYKMHVVKEYNAPVWVPDDVASKCMICAQEFRLYRRKHHCRLCGNIVCHACSSRNFLIPGETEEEDRVERACDKCFKERWGDADNDDDEDILFKMVRSSTLNFGSRPSIGLSYTNTISEPPAAKQCALCRKDFSLFNWRNICSKCNRTVCTECLSKRNQNTGSTESSQRICDACHKGIDPSHVIIDENGNGWRFIAPDNDQT